MSKGKRDKFAEVAEFKNVIQPDIKMQLQKDYELKGKWALSHFQNDNPIVLELGCGKGEYSVGLAKNNPDKNFIGIDIKGARIWRGAKTAIESGLENVCFIRTRIDLIRSFFAKNEIDEIWITFPDPQPKKQSKRLSSARFLNMYRYILKDNGFLHLKTDSRLLHFYTMALLKGNNINPLVSTSNLYMSNTIIPELAIKTFYEEQFLAEGKLITYIKFSLNQSSISEIDKFILEQ